MKRFEDAHRLIKGKEGEFISYLQRKNYDNTVDKFLNLFTGLFPISYNFITKKIEVDVHLFRIFLVCSSKSIRIAPKHRCSRENYIKSFDPDSFEKDFNEFLFNEFNELISMLREDDREDPDSFRLTNKIYLVYEYVKSLGYEFPEFYYKGEYR